MKSGIDLSYVDSNIRPQDDLFRHVNGKWLETTEIPPDKSSYGEFIRLRDKAEQDVHEIVERLVGEEQTRGSDEQKVADLYRSFMDEAAIDALGISPISEVLARISAVTEKPELAQLLGSLQREGLPGLFGAWVDTDSGDSTRYITHVTQSGIGLPDESYYREDSFAEIRTAYVAHITRMLGLASQPDPAGTAKLVMELETRIATGHWDRVSNRDATKTYNLVSRAELGELAPGFDWDAWLAGAGVPANALEESVVRQPSYLKLMADALVSVDLEDWKKLLIWKTISGSASYLSSDLVEANFDFYGRTLTGQPELRERWKRGISVVEGGLGEALGRLYVAAHFPPEAKNQIDTIVANLVEAYRRSIAGLPWMSDETKARALEKLGAFETKIGYPDKWRDYTAVTIDPRDLLGNVRRAAAFETDWEFSRLGKPVDRGEWAMTPQTVNAYYRPDRNEIVFPAAILQAPFFDVEADDAANYGGIGAVIGHEIGHGFDDQGSKYDGSGNLNNWWADQDRTEFEARANALIGQYSDYEVPEIRGNKINGELTVGENIGDLGGLTIAVVAYEIALDGAEPPVIDGLTGRQRLLFGWAQVWRGKHRPEDALRLLSIDPHSPAEFRCNGVVRNVPAFYEAFEVAKGDALWLDADQRVSIW